MVKTFSVEYDQDELNLPKGRKRSFYTKEPENITELPPVRQIRMKTSYRKQKKRVRRDEPQLGAIVYTSSINVLRDYIVRTPRRTFENPAGNFVIIITLPMVEKDVGVVAARIMEQLWRYYRMLNVLLILSCSDLEVCIMKKASKWSFEKNSNRFYFSF